MTGAVLEMREVGVSLPRGAVLEGLSLRIGAGEMLALVGESGSGKTMAALSIPRLLPDGALLTGGIVLNGTELTRLPLRAMRRWRGGAIGMAFQDQTASLHPARRIGAQIAEAVRLHADPGHADPGRAAAWRRVGALLEEVGMPPGRARAYPHELSGGQRQRVAIAMALAAGPALLIADECTAGLDPVAARQILDLLRRLRLERGLALLFVTHDLALVRRDADAVHVLYAGRSAEAGAARTVLARPAHPYTAFLLGAPARPAPMPEPGARAASCLFAPRCPVARAECADAPAPMARTGDQVAACRFPYAMALPPTEAARGRWPPGAEVLRVRDLRVCAGGGEILHIGDLAMAGGECVAVVGASGSGKTTLARAILQLLVYDGHVALFGQDLAALSGAAFRAARQRIGAVFQDPASSLNPAMDVRALVCEPLVLRGLRDPAKAASMLDRLGLPAALLDRLPGTLSGGQAQRVALARALVTDPALLVLDEPTASLDAPAAASLMRLLRTILARRATATLLITHDLAAAALLADRIAVLDHGRLAEIGSAARLIRAPVHPASRALVSASLADPV